MTALPATTDLELQLADGVLTVWLNRPQAKNALSAAMVEELHAVLDAVRDDRAVRALVLRGRGGVFCAGGDIKGFGAGPQGGEPDTAAVARGNREFGDLLIKLNEQPQVVVVAVEGAAIGGGLGLACVGDVTLVTADARLRLSETSLGIPPAQIAPFVAERVGLGRARQLMLTGARFRGGEAVRYGIAHLLAADADDLESKLHEVLAQIALCAPGANAVTKAILFDSTRRPRGEVLDAAAAGFADCLLSAEGREGMAAFLEKRRPAWAGRDDT